MTITKRTNNPVCIPEAFLVAEPGINKKKIIEY
jgi:hypothetical protein